MTKFEYDRELDGLKIKLGLSRTSNDLFTQCETSKKIAAIASDELINFVLTYVLTQDASWCAEWFQAVQEESIERHLLNA